MAEWRYGAGKHLFDDEGYFIGRYPPAVSRAFICVDYDDSDPSDEGWQWRPYHELIAEAIEAFAVRWGGLDETTFLHVLQQGHGRDKVAALFAIGLDPFAQTIEILVPYLESLNVSERYAAASCLGLRRDERALPVIHEYLLCDPPRNEQGIIVPEASWFFTFRALVIRELANWGPVSIVPVLRTLFLQTWEEEKQQEPGPSDYQLHDMICYALARRGAVGALHGIDLPGY